MYICLRASATRCYAQPCTLSILHISLILCVCVPLQVVVYDFFNNKESSIW